MRTGIRNIEILIDMKESSRWTNYIRGIQQRELHGYMSAFLVTIMKTESPDWHHPYCCNSTIENTYTNGRPLGCKIRLHDPLGVFEIFGIDEDQIVEDAIWCAANLINFLHSVMKGFLMSVRLHVSHGCDDTIYLHVDHEENKK